MKITKRRFRGFKKILGVVLAMVMLLGFSMTVCAETTPRIIVTGYTIDKDEVKSGDTFKLTIHLQNVSKKNDLSNIKVMLTTPDNEIVPASGSNTVYIESIAKEETMDVTVDMVARNDLESKSYVLTVATDYEDRYGTPYQDSQSLVIPVAQLTRVLVSDINTSVDRISVGDTSDISFTISNQGRGDLYNVNVNISGNGIKEQTAFIGNITTGGTGYADIEAVATSVTDEKNTVKVIITYEDNMGNVDKIEKEVKLAITDASEEETIVIPEDVEVVNETKVSPALVLVGVAAVILVAVLVVKSKKRKRDGEKDEF